jgi:hypothetical protein
LPSRILQAFVVEDKAFDDELAEFLGRPDAKPSGYDAFDAIADGSNGIKIVVIRAVLLAVGGSSKEILYY